MTRVLPAHESPLSEAVVEEAVAALGRGEVAIIPTDTVYGLAVDPRVRGASAAVFALKRRPSSVPLPVLVADPDQARALAADGELDSGPGPLLLEAFWPGGLTIVVVRRSGLCFDLGGDDATIGLRQPDHFVPLALAARMGPLAATSANVHGQATPATAADVVAALDDEVPIALDAGACTGAASTVVALLTGGVEILREGRIAATQIEAVLGSNFPVHRGPGG